MSQMKSFASLLSTYQVSVMRSTFMTSTASCKAGNIIPVYGDFFAALLAYFDSCINSLRVV